MMGVQTPKYMPVTMLLLLFAAVFVVSSMIVAHKEEATAEALTKQIDAQIDHIATLVEFIDKNQADAQIELIIKDCERRSEYEALLGELRELHKKDLIVIQNLHALCGTYYPTQKALMVAKLEQELSVANTLIVLLERYNLHARDEYQIALWEEIVQKEQARSLLLTEQAKLQGEIIALLISGHSTQSTAVQKHVSDAQNIMDQLNVYHHEIDALRAKLNS